MRKWIVLGAVCVGLVPAAQAEPVAERITPENAAERLFGGTDADGGVGDWYLSNGVVEAVVDDVGPQPDLPAGVSGPVRQSEAAFSGGSLIDLGRVGADNDQLNQMFSVAGLSTSNFILYDSIRADTSEDTAMLSLEGRVLGFEPVLPDELRVVTEYAVSGDDPFVTIRSTITNSASLPAPMLGGFLDVFPWTVRAIVPFSPLPGLGFDHGELDLANPLNALEFPLYAAGPGNAGPGDGVMDPESGAVAGEVAYGILGMRTSIDQDGPEGEPPVQATVERLFGISNVQATALGNVPVAFFEGLLPGGVLSYERRLYVGTENHVASVTNHMLPELGARLGFATGTLSGDVDARDRTDVPASVVVTRTGGPPIANLPDGSPVTQFRTDASGRFQAIVVPAGTYRLAFRSVERDPVVVSDVVVEAGADTPVAVPPLTALAALELLLFERGRPLPGKVTLRGLDGTPDPQLGRDFEARTLRPGQPPEDLAPESFGSALAQGRFVYLPHGRARVELRPGRYELLASRGLEYGLDRRVVELAAGEQATVRLRVRRLVDTPDALSADFHIHSARSLDSSAAPGGRVASFAGEGVEVMVGTDHDFVLDYRPVIEELGLGAWITARVGTEVTTSVPNPPVFPDAAGHVNAWPLPVDATARRDGSIEDEFVAPNFLFSRLRRAGARVIQYNHPRAGVRGLGSIGLFNNIGCNRCANDVDRTCTLDADCPETPEPRQCTCVGYQPDRPLDQAPNDLLLDDDVTGASGVPNPDGLRNIDFDVMEIGNGLDPLDYQEVRSDWFSLLNQAHARTASGPVPFIPATGVSDSHRNTLESAGYFRTYVLGVGDDPARLDPAGFDARVRAGRMMATTGPYLELEVRDARGVRAGLGDTLAPDGNRVTLSLRVQASNWVPVPEVRVIGNGRVLASFDASSAPPVTAPPARPWARSPARVERFRHELALDLERDSWLLLEAGAPLGDPTPDPFADAIVPGYVPLAFTNPVFVDLDGDGFDPPGVERVADGVAAPAASAAWHAARRRREARERHEHLPLHRLRIPEGVFERIQEPPSP